MSRENDFTKEVRDDLAKRVGYRCSRCGADTIGPDDHPKPNAKKNKAIVTGEAGHIVDAVEGPNAARSDPSLTQEQRSSYDNGVWLCSSCHTLVDKNRRFTITELRAWKLRAEAEQDARLTGKAVSNAPAPLVQSINQSGNAQTAFIINNNGPRQRKLALAPDAVKGWFPKRPEGVGPVAVVTRAQDPETVTFALDIARTLCDVGINDAVVSLDFAINGDMAGLLFVKSKELVAGYSDQLAIDRLVILTPAQRGDERGTYVCDNFRRPVDNNMMQCLCGHALFMFARVLAYEGFKTVFTWGAGMNEVTVPGQ